MVKVSVGGREYPFRMTMGALLRFREKTGREASEIPNEDVGALMTLMWCGVKAACNAEGIDFEMTSEVFADSLEPDEFIRFIKTVAPSGTAKKKTGRPAQG